MSLNVGVWIDHQKAIVVSCSESRDEITQIDSNIEKQVRSASGSRAKHADNPQRIAPEDTLERKFRQHLRDFYTRVIEHFNVANAIMIMGPGEARMELKKQVRSKDVLAKIVAVEPADKMTPPQVKARVREFFVLRSQD